MATYTCKNVGCYGDGGFGHAHVRSRLAALCNEAAASASHPGDQQTLTELAAKLAGEMSDDASEEYDALEMLNDTVCDGAVHFEFCDGDLLLVRTADED